MRAHLDVKVHHALRSIRQDQVLRVVPAWPARVLMPQRLLRLQVALSNLLLLLTHSQIRGCAALARAALLVPQRLLGLQVIIWDLCLSETGIRLNGARTTLGGLNTGGHSCQAHAQAAPTAGDKHTRTSDQHKIDLLHITVNTIT